MSSFERFTLLISKHNDGGGEFYSFNSDWVEIIFNHTIVQDKKIFVLDQVHSSEAKIST